MRETPFEHWPASKQAARGTSARSPSASEARTLTPNPEADSDDESTQGFKTPEASHRSIHISVSGQVK